MEKKLYKSEKKMICGVCGGFAEYINIDPTIIRIITVVLSLGGIGFGLILYLIAAAIMPEKPMEQ